MVMKTFLQLYHLMSVYVLLEISTRKAQCLAIPVDDPTLDARTADILLRWLSGRFCSLVSDVCIFIASADIESLCILSLLLFTKLVRFFPPLSSNHCTYVYFLLPLNHCMSKTCIVLFLIYLSFIISIWLYHTVHLRVQYTSKVLVQNQLTLQMFVMWREK